MESEVEFSEWRSVWGTKLSCNRIWRLNIFFSVVCQDLFPWIHSCLFPRLQIWDRSKFYPLKNKTGYSLLVETNFNTANDKLSEMNPNFIVTWIQSCDYNKVNKIKQGLRSVMCLKIQTNNSRKTMGAYLPSPLYPALIVQTLPHAHHVRTHTCTYNHMLTYSLTP